MQTGKTTYAQFLTTTKSNAGATMGRASWDMGTRAVGEIPRGRWGTLSPMLTWGRAELPNLFMQAGAARVRSWTMTRSSAGEILEPSLLHSWAFRTRPGSSATAMRCSGVTVAYRGTWAATFPASIWEQASVPDGWPWGSPPHALCSPTTASSAGGMGGRGSLVTGIKLAVPMTRSLGMSETYPT